MEEKKKQILEILPSFNFIFLSEEEFEHIPLENDIINPYLCLITITVPVVMLRFYVPFLQWLAAGLPRLRTRSNLTFRR